MATNQNGWQYFLKLCFSAPDEKILSELFNVLLTHEERASLETRCLIIKALLLKEKSQRTIAQELNVSIAKITRGSNELKRISAKIKNYLQENLYNNIKNFKKLC